MTLLTSFCQWPTQAKAMPDKSVEQPVVDASNFAARPRYRAKTFNAQRSTFESQVRSIRTFLGC